MHKRPRQDLGVDFPIFLPVSRTQADHLFHLIKSHTCFHAKSEVIAAWTEQQTKDGDSTYASLQQYLTRFLDSADFPWILHLGHSELVLNVFVPYL